MSHPHCPYCDNYSFGFLNSAQILTHVIPCAKEYVDTQMLNFAIGVAKKPTFKSDRRTGCDRRKKDAQSVTADGSPFGFYLIATELNTTVRRDWRFVKDRRQS